VDIVNYSAPERFNCKNQTVISIQWNWENVQHYT